MYISCGAKCSNLHKLCTVPGSGSRFRFLYRCIVVSLYRFLVVAVFKGLGKLHDVIKVQLNIDQDQTPKMQPNRRIPFHIRNKVKNALEELEQEDVIERVPDKQPTPWVSPIVAVPKRDGGVRICMR